MPARDGGVARPSATTRSRRLPHGPVAGHTRPRPRNDLPPRRPPGPNQLAPDHQLFTQGTSCAATLPPNRIETKERDMPQIIVTADASSKKDDSAVLLRERINVSDLESDHFAAQLVERLGWAVSDAHEVETVNHRPAS